MSETIERFEKRCRQKVSEGTTVRYVRAVKQFDDWLEDTELLEATEYDVEDYLLEMSEDGYSGSSIKISLAGIKKFYNESREIDENPADGVSIGGWSVVKEGTKRSQELGTNVHYLEIDEIQELVDNVPSPKFRNELILRILFQTGLRGGELVSVKLSQVDVDNRSIDINADKNYQNRTVYYQPSLATKMKIWIEAERESTIYASESDYLFPTNYAEHLTRHGLDNMFTKAVENAGMDEPLYTDAGGKEISRVTPHSLRHSFAVHSLRRGMDVRTLQELLGHADIETTQVYLDLAKDDVKQKARKSGPSLEL